MSLAFFAFGVAFAAVAVGTLWLTLAPLGRPQLTSEVGERNGANREVLAKRDAAVQALRDLEEDLAQSRITEPEYRLLRERYTQEALIALKASETMARSEVNP